MSEPRLWSERDEAGPFYRVQVKGEPDDYSPATDMAQQDMKLKKIIDDYSEQILSFREKEAKRMREYRQKQRSEPTHPMIKKKHAERMREYRKSQKLSKTSMQMTQSLKTIKSCAQRSREYRQRCQSAQNMTYREKEALRLREYRRRKNNMTQPTEPAKCMVARPGVQYTTDNREYLSQISVDQPETVTECNHTRDPLEIDSRTEQQFSVFLNPHATSELEFAPKFTDNSQISFTKNNLGQPCSICSRLSFKESSTAATENHMDISQQMIEVTF